MSRKIVTLLLCLMLVFSSVAFAEDSKALFKDLNQEHWAYGAILEMIQSGILSGYPEGDFRPNQDVTRGEFAKMMVLALNLPLDKSARSSFLDLKEGSWVVPYVEAAKQYLTGFKSGSDYKFKPEIAAVREDMAVALVKALNYPLSSEDKISDFADYEAISPNLRVYVATAYEKGIMQGALNESGKRYFNAQSAITRAEASVLLMNVIVEEKITFEDIKIPLDNKTTPVVQGKVLEDGSIQISWNKITASGFQGYKVVASTSNKAPSYPDHGYFKWITTASTTSTIIKAGNAYNSGDVGTFKAGGTYYFTVTAVYDNQKLTGNVVRLTLGGTPVVTTSAVKLSSEIADGKLYLNWTSIDSDQFKGYKVVASVSDTTPKYPDNGYYKYMTNAEYSETILKAGYGYTNGDFETFKSGQYYYIAITTLYSDGTSKTSNVIKVKMP
jgi:hypothetical protein